MAEQSPSPITPPTVGNGSKTLLAACLGGILLGVLVLMQSYWNRPRDLKGTTTMAETPVNHPTSDSTAPEDVTKADNPAGSTNPAEHMENEWATAVFAGGCFWCTEAAFEQLQGVKDAQSGYSGGSRETATYRRVCEGDTGHAEVIKVIYDPARISYDQLLDVFFDAHDPTQLNRQGNHEGTQYRSAIFYANEAQREVAAAKIAKLGDAGKFSKPIVTSLEPLVAFYPAEDYHQGYAQLHPNEPYILMQATPKACKIRDKYSNLSKNQRPGGTP